MSPDKEAIKAIFPEAEHISDAGDCDDCRYGQLYFFTLPRFFDIDSRGMVHGGFYCVDCGFSNAGAFPSELVNGLEI